MKKLLLILICLALLFGCASAAKNRSLKKLPDAGFSVNIPEGWWKPEYTGKYFITKDGAFLQYVLIQERPLNKSFRNTNKKISSGMLPQEAAGIIIDELASDRYLINFRLLENVPATVDGHAAFKILFSYADKNESQFKTVYYGFVSGDYFYNMRYCAAKRHYFDKDIADFDRMVSSFKLISR